MAIAPHARLQSQFSAMAKGIARNHRDEKDRTDLTEACAAPSPPKPAGSSANTYGY